MLEKMAHYDVLTGLPNRVLVADRFKQARSHCKRSGTKLAICFLDLDDFKPINDNYGHETGDRLLIEIANRIQSHLREGDTVSRLGGDEFLLILNDVMSFEQCKQTLERIQNAVSLPVMINHQSCQVSLSIGVTLYPDDNSDFDTLLRHADKAMYQAKLAGKHCYALFNPERDLQTIEKNQQLTEIQQALDAQQFQLYYQPKVNMVTGTVFGAEALIRWIHPDKGLIPPLDFLPIVEKTELEITIGNWVIEQALKQLDDWIKQGIKLEISVNIASHHLLGETFCADLEAILAKYPIVDSQYLQLEILETSALEDVRRVDSIIEICQKNLGVKVALDDFGTGYSSLTHLRCLGADTIKIDQSFVRDMLDDPSDSAIVEGVIGLASAFNRELIAEGVETEEHGLMLLMMGCKKVQGYGVAKPMSSEAVLSWLEDYQPNLRWLQYASRPRSILESKIDLFKLVARYWMKECLHKMDVMHRMSASMPVMNNKACPLENWINQIKQQQLFSNINLQRMEKAYEELLKIRDEVYVCYQKSEYKQLETKAEELKTVFEDMIQIADQMLEFG
ncbi:putative bifunctional diguanylate cyclase/phosphodiesterase [methane-oxidizing endosymbiont of Gigantopelta aegis]|uniref:putative bifunctional diguanylate cyclase/phosphodiesterase n=1 Tax=methane-oxidizing endosymbiont of Gigantopelta aegis TaxID=2794938 RepID=UPI00315A95CF